MHRGPLTDELASPSFPSDQRPWNLKLAGRQSVYVHLRGILAPIDAASSHIHISFVGIPLEEVLRFCDGFFLMWIMHTLTFSAV